MNTHELKTWPQYFQAIKSGEKTFELRRNDRNYQVGDRLRLREWKMFGVNNITGEVIGDYTSEEITVEVTYILNHKPMHNNFGLDRGFCCMAIRPVAGNGN